MGIKDDIEGLSQKYKLKRVIFCGCDGENHHLIMSGEKETLLGMVDEIKECVQERME